jgi:transposase
LREKPIVEIARELGISESCLRRWMDLADIESRHKSSVSTDERAEMGKLRRDRSVGTLTSARCTSGPRGESETAEGP